MRVVHACLVTYFLNVVVGKSSAIFKLLASEDETLLIGWDAFLVLDLGFDVVDGVGRFHLEGDGLAREGFDEAVWQNIRWDSTLLSNKGNLTSALKKRARSVANRNL